MSEGIRIDGRRLNDYRPFEILLSRSESSSIAEIISSDNTRVICVVTGAVVPPFPDRPSEGILFINASLSSYSDLSGVSESDVRRFLERSIRESDAIDLESLCIISAESVWKIVCDVKIIDYNGGNVTDAALLSAMAGLRAYRKPDVIIQSLGNEELSGIHKSKVRIFNSMEREPLPLALHHTPLSMTIGIFKLEGQHFGSVSMLST